MTSTTKLQVHDVLQHF